MRPHSLPPPTVAALAALALTACADADRLPATTAAAYGPLELTSLMVLSEDGEHILGNIEEVRVGPNGLAREVVIDGGAPLFPLGRRMVVDADALQAAPFRAATYLTGVPWQVLAGFADPEEGMVALGTGVEPTDWRPLVPVAR